MMQNAFPAIPLLRSDGTGLPGDFQRRDRFYVETASATLRLLPDWNVGLGYSYQQNNLNTYMAFQNDSAAAYVIDQPLVPYKQISQSYWGETGYRINQRLGLNLRVTYNSARSGFRPDVNPNDAAVLGNQSLISSGSFDPGMFAAAQGNLGFSATQISEVIVPQWIGQSKAYYLFPRKFEGGLLVYYWELPRLLESGFDWGVAYFQFVCGRSW
jgi:hypothetical protein